MSPPSILIYGQASVLLETRRLLLEHSGFQVTTTFDLHSGIALLASGSFDVFILCHSLSPNECEIALSMAHSLGISTKILVMTGPLSGCSPGADDQILGAFTRPQTLIETVHHLSDQRA